jgi:hypothetical protein
VVAAANTADATPSPYGSYIVCEEDFKDHRIFQYGIFDLQLSLLQFLSSLAGVDVIKGVGIAGCPPCH